MNRISKVDSNILEDVMQVEDSRHFKVTTQKDLDSTTQLQQLHKAGACKKDIQLLAKALCAELNPHPAGQMELNVPTDEISGERLNGLQHKYRKSEFFFEQEYARMQQPKKLGGGSMITRAWLAAKSSIALTICIGCFMAFPALAQAKGAPWLGKHINGTPCVNNRNSPGGGPYDYRKETTGIGRLNMVENAHFTPEVEQLIKGKTGELMGDIDFVLLVFPNHHRALNSSVEYSLRFKRWPKGEQGVPAECYLQRAINFAPLDGAPIRLYGYYMQRKGKFEEALEANEMALRIYPNDVMVRYNTGLILVNLKRYEEAMDYARPLYEAGLSLRGLKNKLVAAGHWKPTEKEAEAIKAYLIATHKANVEKAAQEANMAKTAQEKNPDSPAADESNEAESTIESEVKSESEIERESEAQAEFDAEFEAEFAAGAEFDAKFKDRYEPEFEQSIE